MLIQVHDAEIIHTFCTALDYIAGLQDCPNADLENSQRVCGFSSATYASACSESSPLPCRASSKSTATASPNLCPSSSSVRPAVYSSSIIVSEIPLAGNIDGLLTYLRTVKHDNDGQWHGDSDEDHIVLPPNTGKRLCSRRSDVDGSKVEASV